MVFSTNLFLFGFLPLTLMAYYVTAKLAHPWRFWTLIVASVIFYGWWDPRYALLIGASIGFNYWTHHRLASSPSRAMLVFGITINVLALAYFKYLTFLAGEIKDLFAFEYVVPHIVLPIGISFFSFQQIALLVDTYRGITERQAFAPYVLFVTFFPQLIAGPIVHHREMMPQFDQQNRSHQTSQHFVVGLFLLIVGLAKKILLADPLGRSASSIFQLATVGVDPTFLEAWYGVLAYTFQIYFDFSAYSDMAMGLALLFGIRLPANFFSPYKSTSIIEFWRRWHMTLSRFLRDYVYIALGGNRKGTARRYTNLLATMIIGGVWHGAGWTFLLWGLLHGLYLCVNHLWNKINTAGQHTMPAGAAIALTFIAVCFAWVAFRAPSTHAAQVIYEGMIGYHGIALPLEVKSALSYLGLETMSGNLSYFAMNSRKEFYMGIMYILVGGYIAFFRPNSIQYLFQERPNALKSDVSVLQDNGVQNAIKLRLGVKTAAGLGALFACVIVTLNAAPTGEFLYFQF